MKSFLAYSLVFFLLFLNTVPEAFAQSKNQKKLLKLEKQYERSCPKKKQKLKKCTALQKKISALVDNSRKKEVPSATRLETQNAIITASEPALELSNPSASSLALANLKSSVWKYTNEERVKAGLMPLSYNNRLEKAAQGHSDDMQARDFVAHENPEGKTALDRIKAAGYLESFESCACNASYSVGENLAKGQLTPEETMEGWMASEGHRKNILNPQFTEIGIGITPLSTNNKGKFDLSSYFWTQNFGAIRLDR